MRYPKGSIQLNESRDLPLLRQILRSGFVTHSQLLEFSRLTHYERSRNSFHWRMRRLVGRGLVVRETLPAGTGDAVYSVASTAATLLQSMGEYCLVGSGRFDRAKANGSALHAIGLNEIHLSALRAGVLVRWIGAAEIRSQNELTAFSFAKDYDAIVTVNTDIGERGFALEFERSPKSARCYRDIAACISQEGRVNRLLYLAANYDILRFVSNFFVDAAFPVFLGLVTDWHSHLLEMPVLQGHSKHALPLRQALHGSNVQKGEPGGGAINYNYSLPFH